MGLAALFIGPENIVGYPKVLTMAESSSRFIGVNPQYMVSIRGAFSTFVPHKTAMFITISILLVSLLPLALVSRIVIKRSSSYLVGCRWLVSISVVLALIVSPHSHYFDCLLLAVPAALTLPTLDPVALILKNGQAAHLSVWHRIWCGILLAYPLISWPINFVPGLQSLGARELEGMVFLTINLVLAVLAIMEIKTVGLESA